MQIEDYELSKCTKRKDTENAAVKENFVGEDGLFRLTCQTTTRIHYLVRQKSLFLIITLSILVLDYFKLYSRVSEKRTKDTPLFQV